MADALDLQLVPCITPGYRMQWEEVQDCNVLLYPEGMVQLNDTASLILEQCDGKQTLAQIIATLEAEFAEEDLQADVLEFIARSSRSRDGCVSAKTPPPLWLLAEFTHSCPLQCPYCSNPLKLVRKQDELDTESWLRVLHDARKMGAVQLGFSGGEPLIRQDLEVLIGAAHKLGYYTNLITSGVGMNEDRVAAFREQGLDHIQISIQAGDQELNNYLAGCDSYQQKIDMARAVKRHGYPMVLCFVIHRENIGQVREMLELAIELEADYVELATTQYEGWALLKS